MAMVRKQIYLTQKLDEKVKRLAKERKVAEAEIIRAALEGLTEYRIPPRNDQLAVREVATLPYGAVMDNMERRANGTRRRKLDDDAGLRLLARMEERARELGNGEGGRTWTREDLYDERLDRFSR